MKKISIILATKNRPKKVLEMMESCLNQAYNPELIEFIIYVDLDDKSLKIPDRLKLQVQLVTGHKVWLSMMYNIAFSRSSGEILMYGSDDIIFVTKNWDSFVRNAFENLSNDFGLVFPNDLGPYKGEVATHGFVSKKWVETFGYFMPPYFPDVYGDKWLTELARDLKSLIYLENVVIEHNHYRQLKSEFDETYKNRIQSTRIRKPGDTFDKLEKQIRIDFLIAALKFNYPIPLTFRYSLSHFLFKFFETKIGFEEKIILMSTNNLNLFHLILRNALKKIKKKFF